MASPCRSLPRLQAAADGRGDRCHRQPCLRYLIASLLALQFFLPWVAADKCPSVGIERPSVTTVYRSLTNETEAVLLRSDCSFERVPISCHVDNPLHPAKVLNFTGMGAEQVHDYPSGVQEFVLDTNNVREADFSKDVDIRHMTLCWSQLTDVDKIVMPPFMNELDLEGNIMRFLNGSKLPNTTTLIYLGENKLQSLDKFDFPRSLRNLQLHINSLTSIRNAAFPPQLTDLKLDANPITDLDYVTLPDSLQTLSCTDCGIKSVVGFRLPSQLQTLNLAGSLVSKFELRESDVDIFRALRQRNITSRQVKPCSDPEATFQLVNDTPICVISDARFDEKFSLGHTPTPSATSSSKTVNTKKSPGVTMIVTASMASLLVTCGLIVAFIWYRRRRKHRSKAESLLDPTTGTRSANGNRDTLKSLHFDREYLKNDVRIDEAVLVHRLEHTELQIVREVAKGGYGVVYLARYKGNHVVLKRVLQDKSRDKVIVQGFMDEIRLCARLDHPKIVDFIGIVWTTLADLGVVIEYMERGDLCTLLHKHRLVANGSSWFDASDHLPAKRSLALDVAEALVYLHSLDPPIIHRDLKSRNVLLNEHGTAKLSDFGISREQTLDQTMTGEVGTVAWIAPEVLQGERYCESADIYSFGVFMAELDNCSHPYDDASTYPSGEVGPANIRLAMLVSAGVLRPAMSAECPQSVQELASRCTSQDPTQRPSAVELHYALCRL